ncbi:MAG: hypothetical protein LBT73_02995 [Tannerellaceae bacterium]|nr:hypothetical protein [Tannerellaceae bacterium]
MCIFTIEMATFAAELDTERSKSGDGVRAIYRRFRKLLGRRKTWTEAMDR